MAFGPDQQGVTEDCVTLWGKNRSNPAMRYYPKIIEFLGYFPFEIDTNVLAGRIKMYRYLKGVTQETLAKELKVNESTIHHYENGKHKPFKKNATKIDRFAFRRNILFYPEAIPKKVTLLPIIINRNFLSFACKYGSYCYFRKPSGLHTHATSQYL
jgi:DNA-binding XRE family transcriptional regulator